MKNILTLLLTNCILLLNAQDRCGTEAYTLQLMERHPQYKIAKKKVNSETEKWIHQHANYSVKTIITIPVVVHVVWKTNTQNISDSQIESQIDVLNKDYRRANIDQIMTPSIWQDIAADCEIEFCLAKIDPNGNPSNGINRVETAHGQFGMNTDIHTTSAGGANDWPNDDYLNIWVCDLGSGLLGYASPPSNFIGDGDGLVIGYRYFGTSGSVQSPYNKGRTATHEIGHWLNLDHIWGWGSCGNDQVSDTPTQEQENYSCPGFPSVSICDDPQTQGVIEDNAPNGDMFMNYMDYVNDACMNMFTNGQKARMLSAINQYNS